MPADSQALTNAVNSAKQQIIAGYAARGMSSDPNQNSSLAQALQQVDQQAATTQSQILQGYASTGTSLVNTANSLLTSGASDTSVSGQLASSVSQLSEQLSAATGSAIAEFAGALAGNVGGGIKINLTGATATT